MQPLWDHQTFAIDAVQSAIAAGERCICLQSPTGAGKSRIACELINLWVAEGHEVSVYTNRKLLVEQLDAVLSAHGIEHGIRAAGHEDNRHLTVQISSTQTENARVLKKGKWQLHGSTRVVIDECHLQAHKTAQKLIHKHVDAGAAVVGLTATPLDLCGIYDHLICAGKNSELRACGALVSARHYGPSEPDLRHIGRIANGEDPTEKENVKAIMTHGIFGRVWEWWKKLNPDQRPTILFAPGVKESIWFAEQFKAQGIKAAHIDGQEVWLDGEFYRTSPEARADVLAGSKDGSIKVLCNRFVLREGIDCPWLYCGIFATVFGSLQSYLQSGGRLLRAHPSLDHVVVQDHGGNWHRHGSLNADRDWLIDDTASIKAGLREDALRYKKCRKCKARINGPICKNCGASNEFEPVHCPQCAAILNGWKCPCGWEAKVTERSREVIMTDGTPKQMKGEIYKARHISRLPNGSALWEKMYWRSRKGRRQRTFRAAAALFARENNWGFPDRAWPFMPIHERDFFRLVVDVPMDRLIPKETQ